MPKPHPREFRDDVVAVARKGEAPIAGDREGLRDQRVLPAELAAPSADVEDGHRPGVTTAESVGAAGAETPEPAAGAGERGAAPGGGLPVAGEPAGKMMYPLVRELAADGMPVTVTCRVLKLARQPYYRWLGTARSVTASSSEAYLANAVFDAHRDDPEYGYRLLADEAREAGQPAVTGRCGGSASANGWWSCFGKKSPRQGRQEDLVRRRTTTWCERDFTVPTRRTGCG